MPSLLTVAVVVVSAVLGTSVAASPSTRTVTLAGPAAAADPAPSATSATATAARPRRRLLTEPPLSTRASGLDGRSQVSWLPGPAVSAPSRAADGHPVARALRSPRGWLPPVTVAGPRRIRTGFPWPPTLER